MAVVSTSPIAWCSRSSSSRREPGGRALGVDAGAVEHLVGVDVADPREDLLIHQRRLDAARGPRQPLGELVAADLQGVGAVRSRERLGRLIGIGEVPADLAQPPRVAIPDRRSGFLHMEHQADVFGSLGFHQPKASGHPRLDDDNPPVIGQLHHDPLAPSHDTRDRRPAPRRASSSGGAALEQGRVPDLDPRQRATRTARAGAPAPSFRLPVTPASLALPIPADLTHLSQQRPTTTNSTTFPSDSSNILHFS